MEENQPGLAERKKGGPRKDGPFPPKAGSSSSSLFWQGPLPSFLEKIEDNVDLMASRHLCLATSFFSTVLSQARSACCTRCQAGYSTEHFMKRSSPLSNSNRLALQTS